MASSTSSVPSSSSSTSLYNPSPTFSGTSTFSSSFQQVLTKAVQEASLPMQEMQNDVNSLTSQQSALTQIESSFQTLSSDVQSISSNASGTPASSVSDPTAISATTTSSALPGTYSIQVDTMGSYSTAMSAAGSPAITDPSSQNISSASSYTLAVDGTDTTITPVGSSLEDLASAINSSSAGVQATIVNVGPNNAMDYRLVITSTSLAADSIQLSAGSTPLLSTVSTGAPATYSVNGSSTVLQTNSPTVTLSPGVTVNLLATSTQPVTVTVTQDYSALQSALSQFATDYNSAVTAVDGQIGLNAGPLSGDSIVYTMSNVLQSMAQYASGSGSLSTLNDLGLSLSDTGTMSFDASTFSALNMSDLAQFFGSATTGGFIQAATNALSSVDDTNTGDLATEYNTLQTQITQQNQEISDEQARIGDMESNLESQLSQADAAIATLQSQKTYYADLFQAEFPSTSTT